MSRVWPLPSAAALSVIIALSPAPLRGSPFLFTNSGAGTAGWMIGAGVAELDQSHGDPDAASNAYIVLGFVSQSVDFKPAGPTLDSGVADFSNAALSQARNCDSHGAGGPTTCYVNAKSGSTDEMQAISTAWADVAGAPLDPAAFNGQPVVIDDTSGAPRTVTVSTPGAGSFSQSAYVFSLGGGALNLTRPLVINGDGSSLVVINYSGSNLNLASNIVLTGGLRADQVLINIHSATLESRALPDSDGPIQLTSFHETFADGPPGTSRLGIAKPPAMAILAAGFLTLVLAAKKRRATLTRAPCRPISAAAIRP